MLIINYKRKQLITREFSANYLYRGVAEFFDLLVKRLNQNIQLVLADTETARGVVL